jgi:hypothetical protein
MNEEEIENHFDDIHDELQAYKNQLDSLKEDLKLLVKHSPPARHDIIVTANEIRQPGSFDQADVKRCQEFLKKYGIEV